MGSFPQRVFTLARVRFHVNGLHTGKKFFCSKICLDPCKWGLANVSTTVFVWECAHAARALTQIRAKKKKHFNSLVAWKSLRFNKFSSDQFINSILMKYKS